MERRKEEHFTKHPRMGGRPRKRLAKYELSPDIKIDYKNLPLLQRYTTERGKIVSRRVSGISSQQQRDLAAAVKIARFLGLLSSGSSRKRMG